MHLFSFLLIGICSFCTKLGNNRPTFAGDATEWKAKKAAHSKYIREERESYIERRRLAAESSAQTGCIAIDWGTSKKYPYNAKYVKAHQLFVKLKFELCILISS